MVSIWQTKEANNDKKLNKPFLTKVVIIIIITTFILKTKTNFMKKIISNLIMFVVLIAIIALVMTIFYKTMNYSGLYVGIPLMIIYSIVCFFIKRVRSKMTIWWGILSLITAGYWISLLT